MPRAKRNPRVEAAINQAYLFYDLGSDQIVTSPDHLGEFAGLVNEYLSITPPELAQLLVNQRKAGRLVRLKGEFANATN